MLEQYPCSIEVSFRPEVPLDPTSESFILASSCLWLPKAVGVSALVGVDVPDVTCDDDRRAELFVV